MSASIAEQRFVGDVPVSAIGLGGASWSFRERLDDEQGIAAIHAALDCGVTLIDTARVYTTADHPGHSEALIARALAGHPDGGRALLATKGGHFRAGERFGVDTSRDAIRAHCETSLRLLGVDRLFLYQLHWPTREAFARALPQLAGEARPPGAPDRTIAAVMETFAELRDEGLIQHVGVCNVSLAQLEEALAVVPIASVQNHFSPYDQGDRAVLQRCGERAIAYLSYSPLGGVNGGAAGLAERFPDAAALAHRKGVSVQRLALAWMLRQSPVLIPICGASRADSIRDSAAAAGLALTGEDLAQLDFGRVPS